MSIRFWLPKDRDNKYVLALEVKIAEAEERMRKIEKDIFVAVFKRYHAKEKLAEIIACLNNLKSKETKIVSLAEYQKLLHEKSKYYADYVYQCDLIENLEMQSYHEQRTIQELKLEIEKVRTKILKYEKRPKS